MTATEIVARRAREQLLEPWRRRRPDEVVAALAAVQAQDYHAAKWAIGLRARGATDADVEDAFNRGALIRTHVLRPTWHFVAPQDLRWLLALTAPRVHAANASYYRMCGVDAHLIARSRDAFARALRDGRTLTRAELGAALHRAGIDADAMRLTYLVMHAEADGVICSGPRRGRQFTYALLDDRVPPAPARSRVEALAMLARRYFSTRGPATLRDFTWWSGLTTRDARAALHEAGPDLEAATIDGEPHWFRGGAAPRRAAPRSAFLLPNYDEFFIAYKDRRALAAVPQPHAAGERDPFPHLLIVGGRLAGRWRRTVRASAALVQVRSFRPLTAGETSAVRAEADRLAAFLGLPVTCTIA